MSNPSDPTAKDDPTAKEDPTAKKAPQTTEETSRFRALLSSNLFRAGVVVVCAAIIFGAWAFARHTTDDAPDREIALELTADDLYEQARQAAERGDTDEAITLLKKVLAEDPDHERAAALLRRLGADEAAAADEAPSDPDAAPGDGDGAPAPPGDGDAPAPGPPAAPYLDPVSDLGLFLPEIIDGWQRGGPSINHMTAVVPFSPDREREVSRALFSVNDRETEAAAKRFIEDVSKKAYPSDASSAKVGTADAYFGTDGKRLATVAFSRGRFAFEVILTADAVEPKTLKNVATSLAGEFEVTK